MGQTLSDTESRLAVVTALGPDDEFRQRYERARRSGWLNHFLYPMQQGPSAADVELVDDDPRLARVMVIVDTMADRIMAERGCSRTEARARAIDDEAIRPLWRRTLREIAASA
jgi:hypothetical protein